MDPNQIRKLKLDAKKLSSRYMLSFIFIKGLVYILITSSNLITLLPFQLQRASNRSFIH